jgi:hypothetical protein
LHGAGFREVLLSEYYERERDAMVVELLGAGPEPLEPEDDVDRHAQYVFTRLAALGVPPTALDPDQLRSLIGRGFYVAQERLQDDPVAALAYRGALEVMVERIADATGQRDSRSSLTYTERPPSDLMGKPLDLFRSICPLWPFC